MDPEITLKIIEGYSNELLPASNKLDTFYRQFICKRCGNKNLTKEIDVRHAFSDENEITPRSLLRCPVCKFLLDPHTGLVVEIGEDLVPIVRAT